MNDLAALEMAGGRRWANYPHRKDSGLDWLGDVPEHWSIGRLKTVSDCTVSNVDKVPSDDECPVRLCNYTDVYYNERITPDMGLMETTATEAEIRRFGLRVGDVLITMDSEEWRDIAIPALVARTAPDLVCGYHLAIVRPNHRKLHAPFLFRLLQASAVNQQFQVASTGVTRYGLPKGAIGGSWIPLPPLDEQRSIASFLDQQISRIDRSIDKTQDLILVLEEQRRVELGCLVTGGVDHRLCASDLNASMHGGPVGWRVMQLRRAIRKIEQGWSPQCENRLAEDGEWSVLKVGCVNGTSFNDMEHKALPPGLEPETAYEVKVGDILMSRANTRELLGSAALVEQVRPRLLLCDKLYRIRVREEMLTPEFLVLWLGSRVARFQMEREATGASGSMQNIGQDTIRALLIAVPPIAEQHRIVTAARALGARTDAVIQCTRQAIERLMEYRQALITAAVTGKIDVRGANVEVA